jgi:hypothetical protein
MDALCGRPMIVMIRQGSSLMPATQIVLAPEYRTATQTALALQIPIAVLCLLMLDGGQLARVCGIAMLGFWIVAAEIAVRRPWSPTKTDLWYWRWGFVPCFVLAGFVGHALGRFPW